MPQFVTSVTERGQFRDCKRKWHLETVERLAPNSGVPWPLLFGNAMHGALEEYYGASFPERDLQAARKRLGEEFTKIDNDLQQEYGGLYQYLGSEIDEHWELGCGMLNNYDLFDRHPTVTGHQTFTWDEVIDVAIEDRAFVEILDPDTRKPLPGRPLLSGKIDLVVRKGKDIWIVDHKTYQKRQSSRALDVDDQLTAYAYIYWRLTGVVPRGCVYNVLIKDLPTEPKLLKPTKKDPGPALSQNRSQKTTHDAYLAALEEYGVEDLSAYTDYLRDLKAKGWSEFFTREPVNRTLDELMSFEERSRYPNPSQRTCGSCSALNICRSMEERGDVDYVRETQYHVKEARYVIPKELSNGSDGSTASQGAKGRRKGGQGAGGPLGVIAGRKPAAARKRTARTRGGK
jgi:CRISPR/Cas system-associated exonuclease Cas4 (RecB family)